MLLDRHLGFMHIARVAQSCRLDNKAEFVQSYYGGMNPSKKFIGTRISRFTEQHIGASNRLLCDNFIAFHDRLVVAAADFPYYRPLSFVYFFGSNHD